MISFDPNLVERRLRGLRLIAAAIPAGVVVFVAVALVFVRASADATGPSPRAGPLLSLLAVGLSVGCIPLSRLASRATTAAAVRRLAAAEDPRPQAVAATSAMAESLLDARQSATLVALGILEVGGLLGCVAYILEGRLAALVAPLVSVAAMAAEYPSARRVVWWLSQRAAEVERLRRAS